MGPLVGPNIKNRPGHLVGLNFGQTLGSAPLAIRPAGAQAETRSNQNPMALSSRRPPRTADRFAEQGDGGFAQSRGQMENARVETQMHIHGFEQGRQA